MNGLATIRAALLPLIALAFVACDRSGAPTGAVPSGNTTHQDAPTLLQSPPAVLAGAKNDTIETKRIGPGGGTLHLTTLLKVRFPEGSLPADTDVTLRFLDKERVLFSIEASGVVITRPIEITFDHLDRTDERRFSDLAIFRQDGETWNQLLSGRNKNKIDGRSDALGVFSIARGQDQMAKGASGETGDIQMLRWLSGPSHETKLVEAARGGDVEVGRFKVKIPKNALAEDTFITVRDPGNGYLMCELEPHGIEFLVPVELEMNIDGLALGDFSDWTIFWFNEESGHWEDQGAAYNVSGHKLTAALMHFSRYAGGRAGW